jgi:glycosyltransferase involved in cell wall biosynthesis
MEALRRVRGIIHFLLNGKTWLRFAATAQSKETVSVCYGHPRIPRIDEVIHGGMVKFQRLEGYFPNSPSCFNILYLGSSALPLDWLPLSRLSRRKGAKVVLNQNGVWYPKHGHGWESMNQPFKILIHEAEYVFYQSQFCKLSADRFLGARTGPSEILPNCADTQYFVPLKKDGRADELVLLLGGNQYELYRLEVALEVLACLLKKTGQNIRLLVTGDLNWTDNTKEAHRIIRALVATLGLVEHVKFVGRYTQLNAPAIYNQAHILLHTKHNDPCPGLVVEAMACGLPVACSDSGGVPELVGPDAGVCVPVAQGWDREIRPDPEMLADAVLRIAQNLEGYSQAARQRAVTRFDLKPWVQRHAEVFEMLLC